MTPKEYVEQALKTESNDFEAIGDRVQGEEAIRLIHGSMGLVTEAAELQDALKKHIFYGKTLDKVNIEEELADMLWYMAIITDTLGVPWEDIMNRNIKKLKARYGDKFNSEGALKRDLKTERKILEGE